MDTYATCRMTVTDIGGNALPNATVYVYQTGTTTPVAGTLYSDNALTQTLSNPLTTDAYGGLLFYMANAQNVDMAVSLPGFSTRTIADVIVELSTGSKFVKVAEQFFQATVDISTATSGAYVDFPAGFTLTVACNAGDRVRLICTSLLGVEQGTGNNMSASLVIDKDSGTKVLPITSPASVQIPGLIVSGTTYNYIGQSITWLDDGVTVGNHVYKPQLYANGTGAARAGDGDLASFIVEVWR